MPKRKVRLRDLARRKTRRLLKRAVPLVYRRVSSFLLPKYLDKTALNIYSELKKFAETASKTEASKFFEANNRAPNSNELLVLVAEAIQNHKKKLIFEYSSFNAVKSAMDYAGIKQNRPRVFQIEEDIFFRVSALLERGGNYPANDPVLLGKFEELVNVLGDKKAKSVHSLSLKRFKKIVGILRSKIELHEKFEEFI